MNILLALAALAQDAIHVKGNAEPITCEIVELTCKDVRFLAGGTESVQPARDIRAIEFDAGRSYDFADGLKRLRNSEFETARDKFERTLRDSQARKVVKQAARFLIVQCTWELDEYDKAIAAARQFRAEFPDTYYLKESLVVQYRAARAKGGAGTADAETALKELDAAAGQKGFEEWRKSADLLRADLAEAKGDHRGARTLYERHAGDRDAQVQIDARLGVMRCLAAMNDWPALSGRADATINEWKGKADPPLRLLLGAYLGRGRALLEGSKKNKDALIELLRAAIDIGPRVGACREHEEALAGAAIAAARHASELKGDAKATYHDRARDLREELNRKYGDRLVPRVDEAIKAIPR